MAEEHRLLPVLLNRSELASKLDATDPRMRDRRAMASDALQAQHVV